jgi:hypothetical protein
MCFQKLYSMAAHRELIDQPRNPYGAHCNLVVHKVIFALTYF